MDQAIRDSLDCYRVCVETFVYCIKKGGKHADPDHLTVLNDCMEICNLNASFMIRNSIFSGRTAELCADICEKCAVSCEAIDSADVQMKACAETCRNCSRSCRKVETRTEVV